MCPELRTPALARFGKGFCPEHPAEWRFRHLVTSKTYGAFQSLARGAQCTPRTFPLLAATLGRSLRFLDVPICRFAQAARFASAH
jgi:hypothetical protein